jgi:putative peptidoglycan lipid II flippase
MLVNVGMAIGLAPLIGFVAAALGTTVAGWVNAGLLWRGVRRLDGAIDADARLRRRVPRIAGAALLSGALALAVAEAAERIRPDLPMLALATVVILALGAYALLSLAFGAFAVDDIRAAMRRERG